MSVNAMVAKNSPRANSAGYGNSVSMEKETTKKEISINPSAFKRRHSCVSTSATPAAITPRLIGVI